jgi:GrpB-like predicted nucleotidyltransferase (UPF0157 family)
MAIRASPDPSGDDILGDMEEVPKAEYIQPPQRLNAAVVLAEADPRWADEYQVERHRIRTALGSRVFVIEHVGSTSVPGLPAKPILDIVLAVVDSTDESSYVPALVAAGYMLQLREPGWFEHRLLTRPRPSVNLHVFSTGCVEVDQMLNFRDRLRAVPEDRNLYERVKRELAATAWVHVQDYADAKSAVVQQILRQARATLPQP